MFTRLSIINRTTTINWLFNYLRRIAFLFVALLICNTIFCQKNEAAFKKNKVVFGVASFYNKRMEGTMTATGEIFHHSQMIAASNHFPLNSWVRITNLKNGKSVLVRINDRMNKSMEALGRVADMTRVAAMQLDFMNRGLARVKVEQIKQF